MELLFTKKNDCGVGFGQGERVGRGSHACDQGYVMFDMPVTPHRDVDESDGIYESGVWGKA